MKLAMVGLGRMGSNMARRLMKQGHELVVYDLDTKARDALAKEGAKAAGSLEEIKGMLGAPAVVWIMLPSGKITEETVTKFSTLLAPGDVLVDGGNSYFKDDVRRAKMLKEKQIRYMDVGTSGGVWGLDRGYSLMIGGDKDAAGLLDPVFASLAPGAGQVEPTKGRKADAGTADRGYLYCGPAGSGHFVKMVHNGIEYGMMQALAEGFHILQGSGKEEVAPDLRYDLDLKEVAEVWRRGSVVSSWLLDLIAISLNADPKLAKFEGRVADSGEGRWTVQAAVEEGIPAQVLSASLFARFRSREEANFADQLLSAMRNQFGGHPEAPLEKKRS